MALLYFIKNKKKIVYHFYEVNGEMRIVPVTPELIDKNIGLLGTKGKLMRTLLEDKKREREL